tara:strand:+ start:7283 stop:9583 length:2301 start_codon:yes stop_codon:yes gene_type:complete
MIIEVKEFKGLATNADPNDIGLEFSRINTNFSLDTLGTLTKQKGRGSHTDLSGIQISQLQYWSPSNLDINNAEIPAVWVGFDATNNKIKKLNNNFSSPTDLGSAVTSSNVVDLNDHGQDFRIASDNLVNPPKILQHISRKFFDGNDTVNEYVFQNSTPSYPSPTELDFQSLTAVELGADTGLTLPNNDFNYKISPIFDGSQELPLPEIFRTISTGGLTKCAKVSVRFPNQSGTGTEPNKTYAFNPRITSFKIYRETGNDDNYYQVGEVPLNTKSDNDNTVVDNTNINKGKDYIFSNTFIDSYTALSASDGIFSMPTATGLASNTLTVRYVWIMVMENNGTADTGPFYSGSPRIFNGGFGSFSGTTATFSGVTTLLNDSTFLTDLSNGFINPTASIPSDNNSYFNFNKTLKLTRLIQITVPNPSGGDPLTEFLTGSNRVEEFTCQNVVWHNKAIHYEIANNKRWGTNAHNGGIAVDASNGQRVVLESVGKSVRLDNVDAYADQDDCNLFKDYVLTRDSTHSVLHFYDVGYTNSFQSPFFGTDAKVNTRYKYSQMIGDIHFVGNVKIDPDGDKTEDHPDFVMFSELGQPDIIPTTNFIRILDQQGGSIIGMNRILNNLVVFMTRGIFRLDVSSGDPSLFTLLEVNTGIGCVAPESIVNAQDNLFFCSKDNIYQIRSDFTFIPISKSIEDTYQGIANISSSKIIYDIKRDRLICTLGNDHTNIFMYDLINQEWTKLNFDDNSFKTANFFTVNDDLGLFTVDVYDNNPSP